MARHEFRTSVGGSVVDHRDRRPRIIAVPNHRWQALLQQVAGVEIQDNDIDGWGGHGKIERGVIGRPRRNLFRRPPRRS